MKFFDTIYKTSNHYIRMLTLTALGFSGLSFAGSDSTSISENAPPLAGGNVNIQAKGFGDVRWILPGLRKLDPKVFGTPAAPLGFEPDVGVPIAMRLTNADATAWTTTKLPTPFSDNFAMISGDYNLKAVDKTAFDDPDSKDTVKFSAHFSSPDKSNTYKLTINKTISVGPDHAVMGGVGTNFIHHGMTGIGTKLMPTSPTYVAFWGIGTLQVNGTEVANNRLVHLMTTCRVRNAEYKLVFDDDVDCTKMHTHLMLPNVAVTSSGPVTSPVPTGFILPNGVEQPFLHIMFENIEVSGVNTDEDND
jgi:hypothetical protein